MSGLGRASPKDEKETKVFTFRGNDVETLPLPAGTTGVIKSISDIATGNVRWTVDGSTPPTNNPADGGTYYETNGPYHEYDLPADLSALQFRGTNNNSRYSVAVVCD